MPPATVAFDDLYNAAEDLISRNLGAGRGAKTAVIDRDGAHSYADIAAGTNRMCNLLRDRGLNMGDRIVLGMVDTAAFVTCFLGAIKAGVVPVPLNTRLTAGDYAYVLADSAARAVVISTELLDVFTPHLDSHPALAHVFVSSPASDAGESAYTCLVDALAAQSDQAEAAATRTDDMCFWLYTSGTTGRPKGAVHLQSHLIKTAEHYAVPVLQITEADIVYSAAKLFFAYGLGNGLTFPFAVGATAILLDEAPTPEAVSDILQRHNPSIFYGVPTLFAMLLASDTLPAPGAHKLRVCTSAGEALPADLHWRWKERMQVDILDGLGSTEMLHIFLSNRPDAIKPGTTGKPVGGYHLRLVDDNGAAVPDGEIGNLEVSGPTAAVMYWNQRQKSLDTFRGHWTRTGDKYVKDETGYYVYAGRSDDMMKVGGIYVSPFEVEGAIVKHPAVLECAVVGQADRDELIKPKAYVVLNDGHSASDGLAAEIQAFVKQDLASFKYPRWIAFTESLPKTATGKIQRFKLRA